MTLVPYDNPFRQLEQLRHGMNSLFNEGFFNYSQALQNPRIDIYDSGSELIASCEIPGLEKKDDVKIEIRDDILTISGIINRKEEIRDDQMHRKERFVGRFQRSVRLPHNVSPDQSQASYKNGVLDIMMPRASAGNQKVIDVNFH